jgi:Coenzyme PQQ synthesis protein D (PqqD)
MPHTLRPTAADLEYRTAGNDVIVHDPVHERVHVLNRTAAYVLQSCDGCRSAEAIAEELSARTGVPNARTFPDVQRALAEFRALELVR